MTHFTCIFMNISQIDLFPSFSTDAKKICLSIGIVLFQLNHDLYINFSMTFQFPYKCSQLNEWLIYMLHSTFYVPHSILTNRALIGLRSNPVLVYEYRYPPISIVAKLIKAIDLFHKILLNKSCVGLEMQHSQLQNQCASNSNQ